MGETIEKVSLLCTKSLNITHTGISHSPAQNSHFFNKCVLSAYGLSLVLLLIGTLFLFLGVQTRTSELLHCIQSTKTKFLYFQNKYNH